MPRKKSVQPVEGSCGHDMHLCARPLASLSADSKNSAASLTASSPITRGAPLFHLDTSSPLSPKLSAPPSTSSSVSRPPKRLPVVHGRAVVYFGVFSSSRNSPSRTKESSSASSTPTSIAIASRNALPDNRLPRAVTAFVALSTPRDVMAPHGSRPRGPTPHAGHHAPCIVAGLSHARRVPHVARRRSTPRAALLTSLRLRAHVVRRDTTRPSSPRAQAPLCRGPTPSARRARVALPDSRRQRPRGPPPRRASRGVHRRRALSRSSSSPRRPSPKHAARRPPHVATPARARTLRAVFRISRAYAKNPGGTGLAFASGPHPRSRCRMHARHGGPLAQGPFPRVA